MNAHDVSPGMPRTRRECPNGPCPHVGCRYHLWTERRLDRRGAVVDLRETPLFGDRRHTCVLNEIARGPLTLEAIGGLFDLSRERVRQIETDALARLRDADPGVLRELLAAVSDIQSDGEAWEDDDHDCMRCEATDAEAGEESTTDDTGVPEGTDEPVADDTRSLPWSEPTSTDPRVQTVNRQRIERASARAAEARPYWCPHCGRTYPGVSILGGARRACPNPRCRARAWGDLARAKGQRGTTLAPEVAAAILSEYRPGVRGYKALAREHGVSRAAVQRLIRGHATREGG